MARQFGGFARSAAPREVAGTADNDEPKGRRQADRDHVCGDEFAEPDSRIEAVPGQVNEFPARSSLDDDVGIGGAERSQDGLQDQGHRRARHRQAQQAGRLEPEAARRGSGAWSRGGIHVAMALPRRMDDRAVVKRAWGLGLAPRALSNYAIAPASRLNGLVLGYANVPAGRAAELVRQLAKALPGAAHPSPPR